MYSVSRVYVVHGLNRVRRWCTEGKSKALKAGHYVCALIYNVFTNTSNNEDKGKRFILSPYPNESCALKMNIIVILFPKLLLD